MGIEFNKIGGIVDIIKSQNANKKKGVEKGSSVSGKKDEVIISKEAMDYQIVSKAKKAMASLPDIREDIVSELSQEINSGNYNVDAVEIADKMLERRYDKRI